MNNVNRVQRYYKPAVMERISFKNNPAHNQLVNTRVKVTSSDLVPNNSIKDPSIIKVNSSKEELSENKTVAPSDKAGLDIEDLRSCKIDTSLEIKLDYISGTMVISDYPFKYLIQCEMDLVRAKRSALLKGMFFTMGGSVGTVVGFFEYLPILIRMLTADMNYFYLPNLVALYACIMTVLGISGIVLGSTELSVYKICSKKGELIESFLREKLNEPISLGLSSEQKAKLLLNGASVNEIDEAEDRANVKDALKIAKEQLEAGQISAREHERYIKRIAEAYPEEVELYTAKPNNNKNRGVK